jgi:integrase/recombinase XerD
MFSEFIKERRYLQNVSERAIQWYEESFKWLVEPQPSQQQLKAVVIKMREKGLKASSCNNRIRAINTYLHWASAGSDVKCGPGCQHLKVPKMKEEKLVLPTFSIEDIKKIIAWKPKSFYERRLYILMLALADTGTRIDELLSLMWTDVDLDNLLLTVHGKGSRDRKIPFSFELRKQLLKFKHEHQLVFPTRDGRKLGRRDVLSAYSGRSRSAFRGDVDHDSGLKPISVPG